MRKQLMMVLSSIPLIFQKYTAPMTPSPSGLIDVAKLTTLQPERLDEFHEPFYEEIVEGAEATTTVEQRPARVQSASLLHTTQFPDHVLIDFRETHRSLSLSLSRKSCSAAADEKITDAFKRLPSNDITPVRSQKWHYSLHRRHLHRLYNFLLFHEILPSTTRGAMRRAIEDVRHQPPDQQSRCSPSGVLVGTIDNLSPFSFPLSVLF
ncbi:unnamed protein product [Rodentolepis nana]|uniref:Uncharacterized protein n=1 Tax=Rodentolepis nana TaxID=102285 RepID=A0A158QGF6_RODNA|nr:unnamed protein product [Rodentolepis nana]